MAGGLKIEFNEADMRELDRALDKLQTGSYRVAAKAAAAPAGALLAAVRAAAPVKTGTLRSALVLHLERSRQKGKQVYDVVPTARANAVLQKQVLHPNKGHRKVAYYPASQEYGFSTKNGKRVPGKHYMGGTLAAGSEAYRKQILAEIEKNIDEAWGD